MYKSYGDVNFFEYGVLVEENEENENEYNIICCHPDPENENNYYITNDTIDITDTWIDKHEVCSFIGLRDYSIDYTDEEKVLFAVGVIETYGTQNLYEEHWYNKNEVIDYMSDYDIEYDFFRDNFTENSRNIVVEFFSHYGTRQERIYDNMSELMDDVEDMEEGDSFTIISK